MYTDGTLRRVTADGELSLFRYRALLVDGFLSKSRLYADRVFLDISLRVLISAYWDARPLSNSISHSGKGKNSAEGQLTTESSISGRQESDLLGGW